MISIWTIFLPSIIYFFHWFFVNYAGFKKKSGILSPVGMRYLWNVVLLILFIPGGLFGLLIGLGYKTPFLVYWHYQGGAAMVIITFIHLLNHLTYYLKGWKTLNWD